MQPYFGAIHGGFCRGANSEMLIPLKYCEYFT